MSHSPEPLISVVIPNYNGERYLVDCLDSLLEQSYRNLELIVVDNGSDDASVELVERNYGGVRLIRRGENRGFSAAVNTGLLASRGQFVVLLNNDTRSDGNFVQKLYDGMRTNPDAAMAAPKMLFARDPSVINSLGLGYCITGANHDIGFGMPDGPQFDVLKWVFGPCGGAGMYRRSLFVDIGLFDEDFFMYYEDVDMSFRAQLAGYRCVSVPSARVYHAEGGSSAGLPKRRNFYFARNSLTVVLKDFPAELIYRNIFAISWEVAKRTASALLKGDVSALMGYLASVRGLFGTMRKRREVQEKKRVANQYIETMLKKNQSIIKHVNLRGRPAGGTV